MLPCYKYFYIKFLKKFQLLILRWDKSPMYLVLLLDSFLKTLFIYIFSMRAPKKTLWGGGGGRENKTPQTYLGKKKRRGEKIYWGFFLFFFSLLPFFFSFAKRGDGGRKKIWQVEKEKGFLKIAKGGKKRGENLLFFVF